MSAITGLANIGNTCYLNSCLQVLSHTTEFNAFLNTAYKKKVNKVPEAILLLQWDKLRLLLWQAPPHSMVVPNEFVQNMQKIAYIKKRDLFTGHAQNDLQEFLLFLIDCFHDALKREVDMEIRGTELNEVDKVARVCYTMMQRMYQNEYSELLQIFYGIHVSEVTSADMNRGTIFGLEFVVADHVVADFFYYIRSVFGAILSSRNFRGRECVVQ